MSSSSKSSRVTDNASKEDFLHGDVSTRRKFLGDLLSDEIKVGFLMLFCENEYCTENIRFVVATSEYRDHFRNDGNSWKSWEVLDKQDPSKWEEKEMHEDLDKAVSNTLEQINANYLSAHSKYEICISAEFIARTEERMKKFKVYGPEVFKEACIDPINTLVKDILPRFVVSDTFDDMEFFVNQRNALPPTAQMDDGIFLPPVPNETLLSTLQSKLLTQQDLEEYCKDDVLVYFCDPLLYCYFLKYLKRIHAEENLLCVAQINKFNYAFESHIRRGGLPSEKSVTRRSARVTELYSSVEQYHAEGIDEASFSEASIGDLRSEIIKLVWTIYLNFLATGSPWEVSVNYHVYHILSRAMAAPV